MRKQILSAAFLAVLFSFAGACVQAGGEEQGDDGTAIEWPVATPEQIMVDGRMLDGSGSLEGPADGACSCTSAECFDAWVVDSFGCDVCVSFVCDGQQVAHACAPCDEEPFNRGEQWTGEGGLQ